MRTKTPTPARRPASAALDPERAAQVARATLPLMAQYNVPPTPSNYAVWFEFASGRNAPLVTEINEIIDQKRPFTPETCDYLYRRHISTDTDKRLIEDANEQAKTLLADIIRLVDSLSNENTDYTGELDAFATRLSAQTNSLSDLRPMVEAIVSKTRTLHHRSYEMNRKLEESTTEIRVLKRNLEQIRVDSSRDFLTGIANRRVFDEAIARMTEDCNTNGGELCLLMIDVDHFKKFNDQFGHLLGDEVLRLVGRTLNEHIRGSDLVARYGGEEFAVLLPSTPLSGALVVADKLRSAIASRQIRKKDSGEVLGAVTVSVGVSMFRERADTIDSFIKRADDALYRSKKGGRNKVTQESA